jgi:hypothetical protein
MSASVGVVVGRSRRLHAVLLLEVVAVAEEHSRVAVEAHPDPD